MKIRRLYLIMSCTLFLNSYRFYSVDEHSCSFPIFTMLSSRKSSWSRVARLLLSFWHLFNENPGHCRPTRGRVSILVASVAASYPESHSHLSLVDVITVTFNMAVTVKIVVLAGLHVERTVNGARRAALGAIEGEIPTTTAVVTGMNPEVTSKVNMEGSVCEVLHKFTVLQK